MQQFSESNRIVNQQNQCGYTFRLGKECWKLESPETPINSKRAYNDDKIPKCKTPFWIGQEMDEDPITENVVSVVDDEVMRTPHVVIPDGNGFRW